jgi:predicted amidophosphoribosyltransferase
METAALLGRLWAELVAALAPPSCPACRAPVRDATATLCGGCRRALPWLRGPRCARCGLPQPCGRGAGPCPARAAAFDASWTPLAHDGPARALVAALKFRGALPVADLMAAQIAATVPRRLVEDVALVPVPLHPARARARGYDHAASIARALAARTGLPLVACLVRGGAATRQLGAGRAARLTTGRLELSVRGLAPRRALLVDDVHTTGATFDACARALRAAGTEHVGALAYARALTR